MSSEGAGKHRIIAVMGPTASGKTDLAVCLHQRMNVEIVSVDSALVYRGMNIGTAKPSSAELLLAPHRLIDIRDAAVPYSAADFVSDATRAVREIIAAGKTPLLVGGTMLYFKALLEGLSPIPPADKRVRADIESFADKRGWGAVYSELLQVDPESAAKIHPNHSQRLGRALEVYRSTGKAMSEWQSISGNGLLGEYDWLQLAVVPQDRSVLHERIEKRFNGMLDSGFIEEVRALYDRGDLNVDLPAIRAVGYRQVWEFLEGRSDYDTMKERGIIATRQLAKRQLTWLRGWDGLKVIHTLDNNGCQLAQDDIMAAALNFMN